LLLLILYYVHLSNTQFCFTPSISKLISCQFMLHLILIRKLHETQLTHYRLIWLLTRISLSQECCGLLTKITLSHVCFLDLKAHRMAATFVLWITLFKRCFKYDLIITYMLCSNMSTFLDKAVHGLNFLSIYFKLFQVLVEFKVQQELVVRLVHQVFLETQAYLDLKGL